LCSHFSAPFVFIFYKYIIVQIICVVNRNWRNYMHYIVRNLSRDYDSADDFKSTQLYTIINEVEGPLDITTEVLYNPSTKKIAVSIANSDYARLKEINTQLDLTVRQRVVNETGSSRNVASIDVYNIEEEYNTWKTDFTSI